MNLLDVVIGGLCLLFLVLGLANGFVRQAVSWAGLILGHFLGVRFHPDAVRLLSLDFRYANEVGYLCVFAAVYLAVRIVGFLFERWVRASKLSGTDRFAGGVAGLLKGAFLSVLLVFFLVIFLPRDATVIRGSKLAPHAVTAARWLDGVFPDRIANAFREKASSLAPERKGPEAPVPAHPKNRSRK